jgi:hypothetical protein
MIFTRWISSYFAKHDSAKLLPGLDFLVVSICTVAFALTVLGTCGSLLGSRAAGTRDFVEYWASGHQLAHHANPYDGNAVLGLEHLAGFPFGHPVLMMPNPPSALLLVLPLGFLSPMAGELLWLVLLLACLVASVQMVWVMHGSPKNELYFLGYSFAPALVCLIAGQVSLFVLFGLVLFLRLHQSRPFLAGISLWLCMLKPHLFLPFGVALLAWVVITRKYKILVGVAAALGFSIVVALILDPLVWVHYGQMMSAARVDRVPIPCVSIMLRRILSPNTIWLQYLPAVFGCIWALAYFRRHRDEWDWIEHGSPLMLISVLVAPYTWFMDQAILIPALLHAVYLSRSRNLIAVLALASAAIEVGIIRGVPPLHSPFYIWTAPAWLIWYLYATRTRPATLRYDTSLLANGLMGE